MSDRLTRGSLLAQTNDVIELNTIFNRIQGQLDQLSGLRGGVEVFDDLTATNLGAVIRLTGAQTITGTKTIQNAPLRFVDSTGALVHAFGTIDT